MAPSRISDKRSFRPGENEDIESTGGYAPTQQGALRSNSLNVAKNGNQQDRPTDHVENKFVLGPAQSEANGDKVIETKLQHSNDFSIPDDNTPNEVDFQGGGPENGLSHDCRTSISDSESTIDSRAFDVSSPANGSRDSLSNEHGTSSVVSELNNDRESCNVCPTPDITQESLTNGHGTSTSTLISKLTALDKSAPHTNTSPILKYLEPFVPASTRLRQIIAQSPNILVCPGVYDGLSARIAHSVGFEGLYMTGAGTTASALGAADLGIAHLHDMRTNAEMIANLRPGGSGPPLIADMDTGYGGPLIIARALQAYVQAGVAGFHIEDQIPQKRCGHLQGKEVVDIETYIQRIKACVLARARARSDIVIIARTDALQSLGYKECIKRLRRARDEGADMGILEGFASKEQARQAVRDMAPWPLCLNSVENGVSPLISVAEAQEMGFRVVIFSFAALSPAYIAIKKTFEHLMVQGLTGTPKEITPATIFRVCGLDEEAEFDKATGGTAFLKGV